MKSQRWLACAAVLLSSAPAFAFDFGVGLEGAGTLTLSKGLSGSAAAATSAGAGLILEERFSIAIVELTLWEDAQFPGYALHTDEYGASSGLLGLGGASTATASYIPIDAGFRFGLGLGLFHPFVGILGDYSFQNGGNGGGSGAGNFFGLGGDLGVDIAVLIFRFGLELRSFWSLNNVVTSPPPAGDTQAGGALVLQALLSARLSF
ncbi:MAG: hypothetical protein ACYDCL_04770 [Myxococcales bacterium]